MALAEGAGVHTGQHHLFGSAGLYLTRYGYGVGNACTARTAAREGDGAVGAEIVASVLNLEECACAVGVRVGYVEGVIPVFLCRRLVVAAPLFHKCLHIAKQVVLAVVAENDVHTFDFRDFCRRVLRKAANHCDYSLWITGDCLSDSIAAFLLGNGCNRTSVYDKKVGGFVKIHLLPAGKGETAHNV